MGVKSLSNHKATVMGQHLDALAGVDLLAGLDRDSLAEIERLVTVRRYAVGQSVLEFEDDTHEVCFILEGTLRITLYSRAGKEISFRHQKAGESFGELAAIDGGPRSASVVASQPATIAAVAPATFMDVVRRHPAVAEATLKKLTTLVRRLSTRIYWLSTPVPKRICAELLDLAREGMIAPNVARLSPSPKQGDIASRLVTHREAVSRVFGQLKERNIIRRGRGELLILDVEGLAKHADPDMDELL